MRLCAIKDKGSPYSRLPSVGFRRWSRFFAVSLRVTWVINPAVGCHYFLPGPQLPPQPLWGLLPISLLGEQRHNGCEQFAWDCYRMLFEPRPCCSWVQHANHSATIGMDTDADICVEHRGRAAATMRRTPKRSRFWEASSTDSLCRSATQVSDEIIARNRPIGCELGLAVAVYQTEQSSYLDFHSLSVNGSQQKFSTTDLLW